jgi:hypothetical protein
MTESLCRVQRWSSTQSDVHLRFMSDAEMRMHYSSVNLKPQASLMSLEAWNKYILELKFFFAL